MRFENIVDVEESGSFKTDIDKGGLHARQYANDAAEINVAGQTAGLGPFDVQFLALILRKRRRFVFLGG